MADLNLTILTISLNLNGLNTPIKRQKLSAFKKKKQDLMICCLKQIHSDCKDTDGNSKMGN